MKLLNVVHCAYARQVALIDEVAIYLVKDIVFIEYNGPKEMFGESIAVSQGK